MLRAAKCQKVWVWLVLINGRKEVVLGKDFEGNSGAFIGVAFGRSGRVEILDEIACRNPESNVAT